MNEKEFKQRLLKEATDKVGRVTKISSSIEIAKQQVKDFLLKEATLRVDKSKRLRKTAQRVDKSLDIRESTANTEWLIPDKSARIKQIEAGLTASFKPYFEKLAITPGAYANTQDYIISPEKNKTLQDQPKYEQEPMSALRMEFAFTKKIIPVDPDFRQTATKSIKMFDSALERGGIDPILQEFIEFLESSHVQLKPYHHRDTAERVNSEDMAKFVKAESSRYQRDALTTASGTRVPTSSFYGVHNARINSQNVNLFPKSSYQPKTLRHFNMEDAFNVYVPTYLLRAITQKIQEGYRLDPLALQQQAEKAARRMHQFHTLFQHSRDRKKRLKFEFYRKYFDDVAKNIIAAYQTALTPFEGDYHLGINAVAYQYQDQQTVYHRWGNDMRGLRIENTPALKKCPHCLNPIDPDNIRCSSCGGPILLREDKHTYATDLNVHQLQWLLYSLTKKTAEPQKYFDTQTTRKDGSVVSKYIKIKPLTTESTFAIESFSQTSDPNGFDTDPTVPELFVPATSPLVKINNQVLYDTEKGNLGLSHMLYYGKEIEIILKTYGEWCSKAWRLLASGNTDILANIIKAATGTDTSDAEIAPFEVWAVIMSPNTGNRTGAETLLEVLQGKIPVCLQGRIAKQAGEPLTYDNYIALLKNLQDNRKNLRGKTNAIGPKPIPVSQGCFDLLQKYGYETAKMMDFVFALMTRACEEKVTKRLKPNELSKRDTRLKALRGNQDISRHGILEPQDMSVQEEYIHGRNYACSTGRAEMGKILFGVMYAFRPPTLGDANNSEWQKKFNDYWRSRHLRKPEEGGGLLTPIVHKTRLPSDIQQAEPLGQEFQPPFPINQSWVVVEKMTFWSGLAVSKSRWCKKVYEGQDYGMALSALLARYPGISQDIGVIFEPVSVMLRDLRIAADSALTSFGQYLENKNQPSKIMVIDEHDRVRNLDAMCIAGAKTIAEFESEKRRSELASQGLLLVDGEKEAEDIDSEDEDAYSEKPDKTDEETTAEATEEETKPNESVPSQQTQLPPPISPPATETAPIPDNSFNILPEDASLQNPPALPPIVTDEELEQGKIPPLKGTGTEGSPSSKPFPMKEPSFIRKNKPGKSLIRHGPDPNTGKIRRSSLVEDLIKLADKLDQSGNIETADKIDKLLSVLNKE